MDSNLDNDQYGIEDLCDALGMSRAQIYRKFKSLIDKTPHDYLRSYRLQKAKQLLLTTNLNVSEVAYRTGFKNISHFSRSFSKVFGKNPSVYFR
jgi:transcriptional regulator GlxA family with amidase domain